ncbi:MAG: hypothetical protein HY366_01695 [Candidatus Aenigmarchaeota archaeon]|nr:hypothetical protein [Candidatus Aenigmarchaeota archaeon]
MKERSFQKFFLLLGLSLLLINYVSHLAVEQYSREFAAREFLPLTFCEKDGDGIYMITTDERDVCPRLERMADVVNNIDCTNLDQDRRTACNKMLSILRGQAQSCTSGSYAPPDSNYVNALCTSVTRMP